MKKILIIIFAFLTFIEIDAQTKSVKRIGFVNPGTRNIEKIACLLQNGCIKTDSVHFIGFLPESQKELLESSKQFVEEHGYKFISFETVKNCISVDSLFIKNNDYPDFLKIFKETDGMIFFGGADIPPKIYGESTFLTSELIPAEQNWEISLLYHLIGGFQNDSYLPLVAQRPDYVVLGICLGMQEMNVASGGSLYQDIPFQVYDSRSYDDIVKLAIDDQHKNYWSRTGNNWGDLTVFNFHHLDMVKNSYLDRISLNTSPLVASAHHQAVKKLGKNFKVSATSIDKKVIEAFNHDKFKNVYGIQFHPDFPVLYDEGARFKISPDKTIQLDKVDRQFYINFWKDFSNRLNNQK